MLQPSSTENLIPVQPDELPTVLIYSAKSSKTVYGKKTSKDTASSDTRIQNRAWTRGPPYQKLSAAKVLTAQR
jgi:hypothetical protein